MSTYLRKKLVNVTQMKEDFVLNYPNGSTVHGKAGDYVVNDNGHQVFYSREAFQECHTEDINDDLIKMWLNGQQEMIDSGFYDGCNTRNYEDEGCSELDKLKVVT